MTKKNIPINNHKPDLHEFGFEENGHYYWWASWYAKVLGYKSLKTFMPSIQKSIRVCAQIGIPFEENFIKATTDQGRDVKLSKFACFIVALQADARKPIVKRARSFFLNELEEVNIHLESQDYLNRMIGRQEIKNLTTTLTKSARGARVKDFRYFMNEGYLGMYNNTTTELKRMRGLKTKDVLSDHMGMTELAANIFRITLTAERLKHLRNPSEYKAARQHWKIGSQIRAMLKENTGRYPEEMPIQTDLEILQTRLKEAQVKLNTQVDKRLNS